MNPFQPLYDACNQGDSATKYANLPEFPTHIDVELTSACNFRCVFCPTGLHGLNRAAVNMTSETYANIIAQCSPRGTPLRFIGWGEPLLHPKVVAFVQIATTEEIDTHINTNGSKLNARMAAGLVRAGLKSLKFSFQGVDRDSFAEARQIDFFEGMIEAIKTLRAARGDRDDPYIAASTSITGESPEMVEVFRRRLEPLVDQLSVGRTIFDFLDSRAVRAATPKQREALEKLKAADSAPKVHPAPCPEVYDKLSIHADGSVRICCNDFSGVTNLGNVNEHRIDDIWRHGVIEQYRKRLAAKKYEGPLCSVCYDYQGLSQGAKQ
ncbi:MAG TPA: radical SAM protein [Aurantimonas coralicida]|uniref:Radical SAM protein n=2 Tax=root TaxID=1 RepID=A0A9C9TGF5_9HYPH|nr:radical SAM protein [Aurantimonas coralicida]HET99657.1 radical SAM protein [Aurantimonas coralicida]